MRSIRDIARETVNGLSVATCQVATTDKSERYETIAFMCGLGMNRITHNEADARAMHAEVIARIS